MAKAEIERASVAVVNLGLARDIGPQAALLEELQRTAGHVDWLGAQISELAPAALIWGAAEKKFTLAVGSSGGRSPLASTDARLVEVKEGPSVSTWLELYDRERKHLVEVCAVAISCGIADRQVQVAEEQGRIIARVISDVLSDLGVSLEGQDVRFAVFRRLMQVSSEAVP